MDAIARNPQADNRFAAPQAVAATGASAAYNRNATAQNEPAAEPDNETTVTLSPRAQALAQLALLNADAGLRAKAGELSQLAQSTTGLAPADAAALQADLTARSDLASARVLHGVGLYAESEAILQRVAGFLS